MLENNIAQYITTFHSNHYPIIEIDNEPIDNAMKKLHTLRFRNISLIHSLIIKEYSLLIDYKMLLFVENWVQLQVIIRLVKSADNTNFGRFKLIFQWQLL